MSCPFSHSHFTHRPCARAASKPQALCLTRFILSRYFRNMNALLGRNRLHRAGLALFTLWFGVCNVACLQTVTPDRDSSVRIPSDQGVIEDVLVIDDRSDAPRDESLPRPPTCAPVRWAPQTNISLNFEASRVRGTVQYNGGPLPNDSSGVPNGRGRLLFVDRRLGTDAPIDLGINDLPTLDFPLQNGDYEVFYKPTLSLLTTPRPDMPVTSGLVYPLFVLRGGQSLAVNIRSVQLSTSVTVNGGAFPRWPMPVPTDPLAYAHIALRNAEGERFAVAVFRTRQVPVVTAPVMPGTYSVEYVGPECGPAIAAAIPCGSFALEQIVNITGDTNLVQDIPYRFANLQGGVTVNGQPTRFEPGGSLAFTRQNSTTVNYTTSVMNMGGMLYYSLRMMAGRYRVDWIPDPAACNGGAATLPCIAGTIVDNFVVSDSRTIPIDLRPLHLTGTITQRGAPLPAANTAYGSIRLLSDTGATGTVPLRFQNGQASYDFALLAGQYQVNYRPSARASCTSGDPLSSVICSEFVVQPMGAIQSTRAVSVDLRPVPLQLNITGSGTPLPTMRTLLFAQAAPTTERFAAIRQQSVQPQFVQEGRYSIFYDPDEAACARAMNPMPFYPCIAVTLKENIPITAGEIVPITLDSVSIHATLLQNGRPFLEQQREGRGLVIINSGSGSLPFDIPIVGAPVFDTKIVPGAYASIHQASTGVCIVGFPSGYLCGRSVGAFCGY